MPVYNTEAYLTDSIDSILGQTFQDWELICVDDGSSDGSLEILRRYERADSRVRVITRPHSGNYRARNAGMALARGRYIAAMDSDDVALPERLRRQVDHMERHPECVGLGAAVKIVGPDLMPIDVGRVALDHETIDRQALEGNGYAIRQPVAMFRTEAVRQVDGYRDEVLFQGDTDIYLRLAEIGRLANLPDILLLYRLRFESIGHAQRDVQDQYRPKVVHDARTRRRLLVGPVIRQFAVRPPIDPRGCWADWSQLAFNNGYQNTSRRYAWRAIRSNPWAVSSWKAVLRQYFPVIRRALSFVSNFAAGRHSGSSSK
jgi:glycosyltransferase involved in cell wall biosynthesis